MEMQQYDYSVQALGAVVAARKAKGLKEPWTERFLTITGYRRETIEPAYRKLFARYEKIQAKRKERKGGKEQQKPQNPSDQVQKDVKK